MIDIQVAILTGDPPGFAAGVFVPGSIANEVGDIYGTSPHRVIGYGIVSIPAELADAAIAHGWKDRGLGGGVPEEGFRRLERSAGDRLERMRALTP